MKEYLTAKECAERTGYHVTTVREWIEKELIQVRRRPKQGRSWEIHISELARVKRRLSEEQTRTVSAEMIANNAEEWLLQLRAEREATFEQTVLDAAEALRVGDGLPMDVLRSALHALDDTGEMDGFIALLRSRKTTYATSLLSKPQE